MTLSVDNSEKSEKQPRTAGLLLLLGARLPAMTSHAAHHAIVDERVAAFRAAPRRSGRDKYRRREHYKRAAHAVAWHLRADHGWRRMVGAPLGLDELLAIHDKRHEEE